MVSPADEQDLLKINGMLIEASKSWKQTHHRKKLMAFPSKKFGEHPPWYMLLFKTPIQIKQANFLRETRVCVPFLNSVFFFSLPFIIYTELWSLMSITA